MGLAGDLSPQALAEVLPGRAVRTYEALLSTEAEALAWARAGAPSGALVVAGYQASPRGRGGVEWQVRPQRDLGFSVVLRPRLPPEREGWTYCAATCGLADALGEGLAIEWPDSIRRDGAAAGAVGVQSGLGPGRVEWAVVSALISDVAAPRAEVLAAAVEAIEARSTSSADAVIADYRPRCRTLGRMVRARLMPLGPRGVEVAGRAIDLRDDGALVVETAAGRRLPVAPQHLGVLEDAEEEEDGRGKSDGALPGEPGD